MAGDFFTLQACEPDVLFAAPHRTSVIRIFISLGIDNAITDAIVDEQGYNNLRDLSCLEKNDIEQLVSAIWKPRRIKGEIWTPSITVPLWSQEIIVGASYALKH